MGDPRLRHRSRPLRKRSRTIPLRGYGEDQGKWFQCWNCGFPCKEGREELGDSQARPGTVLTVEPLTAIRPTPGERESAVLVMRDGNTTAMVLMESDAAGEGKPPVFTFGVSGNGCPFCHTKNWRGDH